MLVKIVSQDFRDVLLIIPVILVEDLHPMHLLKKVVKLLVVMEIWSDVARHCGLDIGRSSSQQFDISKSKKSCAEGARPRPVMLSA